MEKKLKVRGGMRAGAVIRSNTVINLISKATVANSAVSHEARGVLIPLTWFPNLDSWLQTPPVSADNPPTPAL